MFKTTIQVLKREASTGVAIAHAVVVKTRTFFGIVIHRSEALLHLL